MNIFRSRKHLFVKLSLVFTLLYSSFAPITSADTLPDPYEGKDINQIQQKRNYELDFINKQRVASGLSPLALDDSLNKAAQQHSNYLEFIYANGQSNGRSDHMQDPSLPGYVAQGANVRAMAYGYPSQAVSEVIGYNLESYPSAAALFDSVGHRLALLDQEATDIGIGTNSGVNGKTVMLIGSKKDMSEMNNEKITVYPYDGMINTPRRGMYGGGFPISVHINPYSGRLELLEAFITDSAGKQIEFTENKSANWHFVLTPTQQLEQDTTYTVTIKANLQTNNGTKRDINKSWAFTIESAVESGFYTFGLDNSDEKYKFELEVGQPKKIYVSSILTNDKKVDITSNVTFSTLDSSVAKIDNAGQLVGVSAGETTTKIYRDKELIGEIWTVVSPSSTPSLTDSQPVDVPSPTDSQPIDAPSTSTLKKGTAENPLLLVNGKELTLKTPPMILKGNTLVPVRGVFEELGAIVKWDAKQKTITATKGNTVVKYTLGELTVSKNNTSIQLPIPGRSINGTTLVPLRFISEALGATVSWNQSQYIVTVTLD